ncbi:MAG: hypothetical protein K2O40_12615 [Lachnospiraceae bacterium]|nr:hypothetical protein [Lachnospiraceae bacterium]
MKELSIKRALSGENKRKEIMVRGEVYSLHITANGEAIITDASDYEKIYSVQSVDFFDKLML